MHIRITRVGKVTVIIHLLFRERRLIWVQDVYKRQGHESVATLYRFNELKQLYHLGIRLSIAFSCWKMNDLKTNRQKHPNNTQKKPRL